MTTEKAEVDSGRILTHIPSVPIEKFEPRSESRRGFCVPEMPLAEPIVQIVASYHGEGLLKMMRIAQTFATPARYERALREGMGAAGDKTRTIVRKALKRQMGTKTQRTINSRVSGAIAEINYEIKAVGKGLDIAEFPTRISRSLKVRVRWSPREHWRFQIPRSSGMFGKISNTGFVEGSVTARVWGVAHTFKRSYVDEKGLPRAALPGRKAKGRRLFGPAIWKEAVKDQSAREFQMNGPREMETAIGKRLARILAGGGG